MLEVVELVPWTRRMVKNSPDWTLKHQGRGERDIVIYGTQKDSNRKHTIGLAGFTICPEAAMMAIRGDYASPLLHIQCEPYCSVMHNYSTA